MRKTTIFSVVSMLILACLVQAADISFTVTISDVGGNAQALVNDFADAMGWKTGNPLTRGQYAKNKLQDHIREVVKAYRAQKKADDARVKELSDADALIIFK